MNEVLSTLNSVRKKGLGEMYTRPQWLLWRYEHIDGKDCKIPYGIKNGNVCKPTGEKTTPEYLSYCRTYDEMVRFAEQHPSEKFDGVGIQLPNGYIGIDLDHCINENGEIAPAAIQIIERINSYAEYSPSGHGIRIFAKGSIPGERSRKEKREIYDSTGNYLTVTGNTIKDTEIIENQPAIDWFYKEYIESKPKIKEPAVIQPASEGMNTAEIIILAGSGKDPVLTEYYFTTPQDSADPSADDLALCNKLAFYSAKNPQVMDEVFRASKRLRDKWDEKHTADGRTYGELTIQKAIDGTAKTYDRNRPASDPVNIQPTDSTDVDDEEEFLDGIKQWMNREDDKDEEDILVECITNTEELTSFSATSKSGKSIASLELTIAIASGTKWFGKYQCKKGRVLYFDYELKKKTSQKRFAKILKKLDIPIDEVRGNFKVRNFRNRDMNVDSTIEEMKKELQKRHYDMIILDPLYMIIELNENDNIEMKKELRKLQNFCEEYHVAIFYTHHFAKGSIAEKAQIDRGSGAGTGSRLPDNVITLSPTKDKQLFVLEGSIRDGKELDPTNIRYEFPLHTEYNPQVALSPLSKTDILNQGQKAKSKRNEDLILMNAETMYLGYPDGYTLKQFIEAISPVITNEDGSTKRGFSDKSIEKVLKKNCNHWTESEAKNATIIYGSVKENTC